MNSKKHGEKHLIGESMVKTLVLRVEGTNAEEEMIHSFRLSGSEVDIVHVNDIVSRKKSLEDYQIIVFPGGFAHGDDVSAGKILANILRYKIWKDLTKFIDSGKLVIGVCNGFQAITKAGLLPAIEGIGVQECTLTSNDSGYFIDKWVELKHASGNKCVFTKNLRDEMFVPINHGEGKFVATPEIIQKLEDNGQIVFRYSQNPNGSINDIAGICNSQGNVFGMMPHPEKYFSKYMHPFWTRMKDMNEEGDGLQLFKGAVDYAK